MKWWLYILSAFCCFGQLPGGMRSPSSMDQCKIFTSNDVFALSPSLWVMADIGVTNTSSNPAADLDRVLRWGDCSGNGYNLGQSVAGRRPLFRTAAINGYPTLDFGDTTTATRGCMTNPIGATLNQPGAVFIFLKITNGINSDVFTSVSPGITYWTIQTVDGLYLYGSAGTSIQTSRDFTTNAWMVVSFIINNTKSAMYLNGAKRAIGNAGTFNNGNGIAIGTDPASTVCCKMWVSEVIYFAGKLLKEDERRGVEQYLFKKYNMPVTRGPFPK